MLDSTPTALKEAIDKAQRAKEDQKVDEGNKILYSWVLDPDYVNHPYASTRENQAEHLKLTEQLSRCKKVKTSFKERLRNARIR